MMKRLSEIWQNYLTGGLPASATTEQRRQVSLFNVFSLLAAAALIVFGWEQLRVTSSTLAWVELVSGLLILLNVLTLRLTKRGGPAKNILITIVLVVLTTLLLTGGIERTGIFWFFMWPVAVFFLAGKRQGLGWIIAVFALILAIAALSAAGAVTIPYSWLMLRQTLAVMAIISALVYVYENNRQRDATAIEAQRRDLAAILDNLPVGVVLANVPSGQLTLVNKVGLDLLGRGLLPGADPECYGEVYNLMTEAGQPYPSSELPLNITLRTGQPNIKSNIVIHQPSNKQIVIRAVSAPLHNARGIMAAVIVVFEDISQEREIEKMKSEFVSVASHQLRTPLTGVKWLSQLLLRGKAGTLSTQQQDFLQQINDSNERMIALVEDLLNVSRIETGRKFTIVKKPTDVVTIVDSLLTELIGLAAKRKVSVVKSPQFPPALTLNVDEDKIRQVLQNLLSNAVKYSHENGQVEIGYHVDGSSAVLSVRDQGLGIPANQQSRIFEKFFRANNVQTHETDGTGLGLYIAKAIAEGHGGKVWFESKENVGATFSLALPK